MLLQKKSSIITLLSKIPSFGQIICQHHVYFCGEKKNPRMHCDNLREKNKPKMEDEVRKTIINILFRQKELNLMAITRTEYCSTKKHYK